MGGNINLQRAVRSLALPAEGRGPAHEIDGRAQNGVLVSPIISVDCENYLAAADTIDEADAAHGRMRVRASPSGPKQPTGDA
jgi:hypothetical protein